MGAILGNIFFSTKYKLYSLKFDEFKKLNINFINSSVLGGFCRPINRKLVKKIRLEIEKNNLLPIPFIVKSGYLVDGVKRFSAIIQIYEESAKNKKNNLTKEIENIDFPVLEILSDLEPVEILKLSNCSEKLTSVFGISYVDKVLLELNSRKDSPYKFKIKIDKNGPGEISLNKIKKNKYFKKLIDWAKKNKVCEVMLAQKIINSSVNDLEEAIKNVDIN